MSVVIAIKHKNKIYVGCDSQASGDNLKSTLKQETQKIWQTQDGVVLGGVGRLRDIQLALTDENLVDRLTAIDNKINLKYVITTFYNSLYNVLLTNKAIDKDEHGNYEQYIGSSFLIAHKNKAFRLYHDGSADEINDYLVMGSGKEVATGVLETNKTLDPETRIRQAIKACSDTTLYVDNNIHILRTK